MKASELYASPFLKAQDLQKPVKVTISMVSTGEFQDQKSGQKQGRIILTFQGAKKTLVLNATQARTLIAAYGDDCDHWVGKGVILSPAVAPSGTPTIGVSAVPEEGDHGDNPFA